MHVFEYKVLLSPQMNNGLFYFDFEKNKLELERKKERKKGKRNEVITIYNI